MQKGVLKNFTNFTGKHLCQSFFFNKVVALRPVTLLKKETLVQVFSCEFCEVSRNTFFTNTSGRLFLYYIWWNMLIKFSKQMESRE